VRVLRKEWKNRRSGFSRRARWYDNGERSFRIELEDEYYRVNRFFGKPESAKELWDIFVRTAGSDIPSVIDGKLVSVVQLALKVTGNQRTEDTERKSLGEQLADLERTPEFARAQKWLSEHAPGARLPEDSDTDRDMII